MVHTFYKKNTKTIDPELILFSAVSDVLSSGLLSSGRMIGGFQSTLRLQWDDVRCPRERKI